MAYSIPVVKLYDKHRGAGAILNEPGLTAQDLQDFCKAFNFSFHAMGEPGDWSATDRFRCATLEYSARGVTVLFSKVHEWLDALKGHGDKVVDGGMYQHYKGGTYTTVCTAMDEFRKETMVVYRGEDGAWWTRPYAKFFDVVLHEGKLVAPFKFVGLVT